MKFTRNCLILILLLMVVSSIAQNIPFRNLGPRAIVGNQATPASSASVFQVESTTGGLVHARLTTAQRDAISAPLAGLTIFNTDTATVETYDGLVWSSALGGVGGFGTDECLARWDGTSVAALQDSIVCITDTGTVTGVDAFNATSSLIGSGVFSTLNATTTLVSTITATTSTVDNLVFSGLTDTVLAVNSAGLVVATTTGTGSLTNSSVTSTDNALARWDGAGGDFLQNSGVTLDDSNNISGVNLLTTASSTITNTLTLSSVTSTLLATNANGVVSSTTTQFVTGPSGATANSVAVFDGTTGQLIKDSDYGVGESVTISGGNIAANQGYFLDTIYLEQTSPLAGPLYLGICVSGSGFCVAGEVNATSTLNVDALSAGIPINKGGTGANLTGYTGGGVVYGHPDGTQLQVSLGGTVTGQALTSVKGTRPEWFSATSSSVLITGTSGALDVDNPGFTYASSTNTLLVDGTINTNIFSATTSISTGTFTAATATISGIATNSFVATNSSGFLVATTTPTGGGTALAADAAILYELQSGAAGGTFSSGSDQTRILNTENDPNGIVTLASNQFTLGSGTYYVHAVAPAFSVNGNRAKIQNITFATPEVIGANNHSGAAGSVNSPAIVSGIISATGTETFELQHQCDTTKTTNGFGLQNSYDGNQDIFSVVYILRVGD